MTQQKRSIERRIAEVHHFEINGHYLILAYQKVFRAPIAMHQAHPAVARCCHDAGEMSRQRRMAQRGGSIIWVQTQLIEYGLIAKLALAFGVAPTRPHDGSQQTANFPRNTTVALAPH